MRSFKGLLLWFFGFVFLVGLAAWKIEAKYEWRYVPLNELVYTPHYIGDIGFLLDGSHNGASDLAYIQLLQYYGQKPFSGKKHEKDSRVQQPSHSAHRHDGKPCRNPFHSHGTLYYDYDEFPGKEIVRPGYPKLLEYGTRQLRLNPFFNGPILETAGLLAFIEERPEEALALLREAIQKDPSFWRYHLYMGAILYKHEGKDMKLIYVLEEAIQYPDCPVVLENILANLLKKYGEYERAARVLLHTMKTAPQGSDRNNAQSQLLRLLKGHPEIAPQVQAGLAD